MMAATGTAATPSLSTILDGFDNLALNIATYLSAQDVLSLHNVNRSWHNVLNMHEELLFEHLLSVDFVEGEVLNYVAKRDNLSRKKLHLAFHKRWSLPKQGDEKTRICITWTRPDIPQNVYAGKSGINSLVFIARVGDENASNSCALLEWNNPDYDSERRQQRNNEQLIIDTRWRDDTGGITLAQNQEANEHWESGDWAEMDDALKISHTLTLHAVDISQYRVATLMDESSFDELCPNDEGMPDYDTVGHGFELPKLFGLPPKGSPYYRNFDEEFDLVDKGYYLGDEDVPSIEYLPIWGVIELYHGKDDEGDNILSLHDKATGLNFCFDSSDSSTLAEPYHICSFLGALMREKCTAVEMPTILEVVQQPEWVQSEKIVDRITSYASFEDQAGKLRLVCRQFGSSALTQLEGKLEKTKVIGFDRGEWGNMFKASVRWGWSESCVISKEDTIEDSLWLAGCRCGPNLCEDKQSCPHMDNPIQYSDGRAREPKTLDVDWAREQLVESGRFEVEGKLCKSKCSFNQEEMSIYQLCDKIKAIIHSKVEYAFDGGSEEDGWGEPWDSGIPAHFQRFYGVSKAITSKQFLRSLFLVFTKARAGEAAEALEDGEENTTKRARLQRDETVKIGMAEATTKLNEAYYHRSMSIFRFYSAAREPMEVCLEYYGGFIH